MRNQVCRVVFTCATLFGGATRAGNIVVDNSFGRPGGSVGKSNQTYALPASLGMQKGGNLFYSFSQFNLDKGETANFTSSNPVNNVFCRVTAAPCMIDGTIKSSISTANFYLIDSQGVVFGPDAQLNVGGSFIVTTADNIKFSDGGVFTAVASSADSVLTSAAPAAFGFLNPRPAAIVVNGTTPTADIHGNPVYHPSLNPAPSGALTIIGGDIHVAGGELATNGSGATDVVSVASAGKVTANPSGATMPYDVSTFSTLGQVEVSNSGFLGAHAAGDVNAGPVFIQAGNLSVDGASGTFFSVVGSFSGNAAAGDLNVNISGNLDVTGGGEVGSDASSELANPGTDSGLVQVLAKNITVSGTSPSGLLASAIGSFSGSGIDGTVIIHADNLSVLKNGEISTLANGLRSSGNITITVSNSTILNGAGGISGDITGITAQTVVRSSGDAGTVTVTTGSLDIEDFAEIASTTFGSGNGGNVTVAVSGSANLTGTGSTKFLTGITAQSNLLAMGNAGSVSFSAGSIRLDAAAAISSASLGIGNAGSVNVSTNGGTITLSNDSSISVSAVANQAGSDGGNIAVVGQAGLSILSGSNITSAATGNGGSVSLIAGPLLYIQDSLVTAQAGKNGGAILLDPGLVVLDNSTINGLSNGLPVKVQIVGDLLSQNSRILTNTQQSFPSVDISAALIRLPQPLFGGLIQLAPTCAQMISGDISSFVLTGHGGLPIEPGGWMPIESLVHSDAGKQHRP